ncbi:uncharacterized protein PV09_00510 [Verruconis gallopava]|uniref:Transcription initiation factor IIA subunit 1 n=1 Tax=Verruconis gallopava TaxID=253628 RepID=A0A0D1Z6I1_9PEZI|nr:uncharacterized protein PV09_00510 [Verruconis gallopava]KIW08542.1 hypothetical protein PV09_00510 [Verruconis gallopava]
MSNQAIGSVYATIIDRIIAESKDDFEAAGLDQETLQELKQTWQKNISKLGIAQCPWDPAPPPQQIANPPTVPSNVKPEQPNSSAPVQRSAQPTEGTPIKQEQGVQFEGNQSYQQQPPYSSLNPQYAQQRADAMLRQQFGSQANASIQAGQARQMQMAGGQQRPTHIQLPPRPGQAQFPQQQPPLSTAQTDGAGDDALADWKAAVAERHAFSEQDRAAADHQLRDYLQQSVALEESGLLLPASEQSRRSKKHSNASSALRVAPRISIPPSLGRFDGPDDEDSKDDIRRQIDADEDAINSDLDDSDDELDNVDDEEGAEGPMGETILCTYDKVQRVKNKWKCTLKDGILTTGKKEYVFHKAQGEFEW